MNFVSIIAAAVATLIIGFIWYHPKVFGKAWKLQLGDVNKKSKPTKMPLIIGVTFVLAILAAFFLYTIVNYGGGPNMPHGTPEFQTFKHGAFHGAFLGSLIGIPMIVTNGLYEQRSFKYLAINAGYWMVSFTIMGGIVCQWP
ncbi:MAG: DUF1761 domain-containing protein [Chitinophagales bacterium]